jgi:hypothetical protein
MKGLVYITGNITFADLDAARVSHVDVHEAQVRNWLLKPARHLAAMAPTIGRQYEHGMALFALELMFFEPHGQYLTGENSDRQSGRIFLHAFERFRRWLLSRDRIGSDFTPEQATKVRDWARNGLFHSGQIKDGLLVDIRNIGRRPFFKNPLWDGWLVDPWQLLNDVEEYFGQYITILKTPSDPEHQEISKHFERTFQRLLVAPAATRVPG